MINGANAQADALRYIAEGMHANHYSVRMTRTAPGTDAGDQRRPPHQQRRIEK